MSRIVSKNSLTTLLGLATACLLTLQPASAQSWKPAILDNNREVKDIIDDFYSNMAALVAQAGGEARVTLLRAFQFTDSLISALQSAYASSLKLTFGELDKQQQKAFQDTNNLLNQTHDAMIDPVNHALQLGDNLTPLLQTFFHGVSTRL